MGRISVAGLVFAALALIFTACAPSAAPAPAPTSPQTRPAAVAPQSAAPQLNPDEVAWQKIVDAAQKEGQVNLYAAAFLGDTGIATRNAFKARYNIDLDIVSGRGAEFIERLKTERRMGNVVGDVVQTSTLHTLNMKGADLLDSNTALPVFKDKNAFMVDPVWDKEGYALAYIFQTMGPVINTNLVKPGEEPKSWQDMLNPKWKGKMLASDPLLSSSTYIAFVPLLNARAITQDWLRGIGQQQLSHTRGDQDTADKLSRGEFPLTLTLSDAYAGTYVKEGAPIRIIPMAEGYVATVSTVGQIKKGPHPNAAKVFLNWLLSAEGQTIYNKARSTASIRNDVPVFRPPALILPPNAKIVWETVSDVLEETQKFTDKWMLDVWKK